jgi:hypothetical protein
LLYVKSSWLVLAYEQIDRERERDICHLSTAL